MIESTPKSSEFYIVDFDRTLADSNVMTEIFTQVAEEFSQIPKEQIERRDAELKQRGDTFFLASYVREQLNREGRVSEWTELEKRFIHESRALNYLLPGATELLERLEARGYRYGILTYGDPLWQRLKLTAAGFNHVKHIITEQKEKSALIRKWQLPDESFEIPQEFSGGVANSIVLIDDKAVSFSGFPGQPSRGYWVVDKDNMLPSQSGEVPENVAWYPDLPSLVDDL